MSQLLPVPYASGRWVALTSARQFMVDLLHYSRKMPALPMQRTMDLSPLIQARAECSHRICWNAIFVRAYALVAARHPELRRTFMPFPWAHFYEHPVNVATVSVEREYAGEKCVFFAQLFRPERTSLLEIDRSIRLFKTEPIESIDSFRGSLQLGSRWWPIRRSLWWAVMNLDGATRATRFGTFGVSTVAALGGASLLLISPLSTTINYGQFQKDGSLDVRLTYDHRVLDGAEMARIMVELETELCVNLVRELHKISKEPKREHSQAA